MLSLFSRWFTKMMNDNNHNDALNEQTAADQENQSTPQETQKTDSYREQFLRLNADLQNFKKRVERERGEWMQLAQISMLKAFLPTVDDLERAITTAQKLQAQTHESEQANAWLEGFILIHKNLVKQLTDLGVTEIDCSGMFNPELHEALMQTETPDIAAGTITAVLTKGYMFQGKIIRHAQVSVAR